MPDKTDVHTSRDAPARIAFFIPDLGGGGAERVVVNLVNHYVAQGIPITLVLARAEGELLSRLDERVTLVDLAVRTKALSVVALARYLRRARPDCLVSHMDIANVAACAAQRLSGHAAGRLVLCCHLMFSKQLEAVRRPKDRVVAALMRRLYPTADQIIAVSHGVAEDIAAVARIPLSRFDVVHNPAYDDTIPLQAGEDPHHPWLVSEDRHTPVIITAGRLTYQKDFGVLIDAVALIQSTQAVRLIILGTGPLEAELRQRVSKLGLDEVVDFAGFQRNPFAYINRADVFALTSRWEGFGNVIVEALACGTPVVSTDCPAGPAEILEHGQYGQLVRVGDKKALAEKLTHELGNCVDHHRLQARAQCFSVDHAAHAYWRVIAPTYHLPDY